MREPRRTLRARSEVRRGRVRLGAALCASLLVAASPAAARERARLGASIRSLSIPAGAFALEQRSSGVSLAVAPAAWISMESGLERSTTELVARDLQVRPLELRTRLDVERRWGFFHSIVLRTHRFPPGRLEAFGDLRWMPGSAAARIQDLVLHPLDLDLSAFGSLADLIGARLAWWQTAMGARLAVRVGPLDAWLDGGATWVHLELHYALTAKGRDLGEKVAPDGGFDGDGGFVVEEAQPFARLGALLRLPGPFELRGFAGAVPTKRGLAAAVGAGVAWVIE
jgi:hypothetical protein